MLKSQPNAPLSQENLSLHQDIMDTARTNNFLKLHYILEKIDESNLSILDVKNDEGKTAMIVALGYGNVEIAKQLLLKGADYKLGNNSGQTAQDIAKIKGYDDFIKLILRREASLKPIDDSNPLITASQNGNLDKVRELIQSDPATVYLQNKNRRTAIMIASQYGHHDLVMLFINTDTDLNSQDINDKTAMMLAIEGGHYHIAGLLIDKGAKLNLQDKEGKTALMIASQMNSGEYIVDTLLKNGADCRGFSDEFMKSIKSPQIRSAINEYRKKEARASSGVATVSASVVSPTQQLGDGGR